MLRQSLFAMFTLIPQLAGAAACATATPSHRVAVLELYTSEGCSSCPPADRWLRGLAPRDDLVVVAFHVDYWDRLGWKDPWGDARYSARQQWRAARTRARAVYTPDVVFDGRSRTDWARGWMPARSAEPAPFSVTLRATAADESRLRVDWASADVPAGASAWLAITQSGLASTPVRGENAGVPLRHSQVVRVFAEGLDPRQGSLELALPRDLDQAAAGLQFVVEDLASATPLHGASLPLGGCAAGR